MPVPFADAMPPKSPYGGTVRGVLVKQNTTHSTSDYAKKVYCVLTGYTLWEYDDEAAARCVLQHTHCGSYSDRGGGDAGAGGVLRRLRRARRRATDGDAGGEAGAPIRGFHAGTAARGR